MQGLISKGCLIVMLALMSVGCVTTITSGKPAKLNLEKALESYVQLGLNDLRNKKYDLARLHFNKAAELNKNSPGVLNGRALLHQFEGETKLAEEFFRKALKSDKNFSQARNNYASFLYQQERYEEAYEQFETTSSDLEYNRRAFALLGLGRTALKLGNLVKAQSAFERALTLQPRLTLAMVELAEINFDNKEYSESKKYLDQYTASARQSPRTLWLGIRIERIFGNKDKEASYALALKNMHPYSKEYLEYQRVLKQQ